MNNRPSFTLLIVASLTLAIGACSDSSSEGHRHAHGEDTHSHEDSASPSAGTHTHADGSTHDKHADGQEDMHQEIPLEEITIIGMNIQLTQNHGTVSAGEEEHLIVQIGNGDTDIVGVRAWIGSEDRTLSYVGKGEYSIINDAYDIHTMAPEPLDENAKWWIEIELPDGTRHTGSAELVK